MESKITKKKIKEKKQLYRDIYCYRDIELVISWYKILVISPTPTQACDKNVMPLTVLWCIVIVIVTVSRRDDTKTIKPIINKAFVASSGDIITDYNDLYCLVTHKHYHVCICDRRKRQTTSTTLHCSKLAFESSVANSLNMKTYLQAVSQKRQTVLAKLELSHFIETAFVHSTAQHSNHCRLLFQAQEIVLCKMCCTHSNIWVELFWSSVVNTT